MNLYHGATSKIQMPRKFVKVGEPVVSRCGVSFTLSRASRGVIASVPEKSQPQSCVYPLYLQISPSARVGPWLPTTCRQRPRIIGNLKTIMKINKIVGNYLPFIAISFYTDRIVFASQPPCLCVDLKKYSYSREDTGATIMRVLAFVQFLGRTYAI